MQQSENVMCEGQGMKKGRGVHLAILPNLQDFQGSEVGKERGRDGRQRVRGHEPGKEGRRVVRRRYGWL